MDATPNKSKSARKKQQRRDDRHGGNPEQDQDSWVDHTISEILLDIQNVYQVTEHENKYKHAEHDSTSGRDSDDALQENEYRQKESSEEQDETYNRSSKRQDADHSEDRDKSDERSSEHEHESGKKTKRRGSFSTLTRRFRRKHGEDKRKTKGAKSRSSVEDDDSTGQNTNQSEKRGVCSDDGTSRTSKTTQTEQCELSTTTNGTAVMDDPELSPVMTKSSELLDKIDIEIKWGGMGVQLEISNLRCVPVKLPTDEQVTPMRLAGAVLGAWTSAARNYSNTLINPLYSLFSEKVALV